MEITVTTRHFKADEKIKEHLNEKLEKLEKFFSKIISARAIFTKEGYRNIVEITLLAKDMQLVAKETSEDMYSAVDNAVSKLQKQLTKTRDKIKEHKGRKFAEKEKQLRLDQVNEEIV